MGGELFSLSNLILRDEGTLSGTPKSNHTLTREADLEEIEEW